MKITRRITLRTALVLVFLAVVALLLISSRITRAQTGPSAVANYACTPDYVAAFTNRVHAHCSVAYNSSISWFAACSTGSGSAFASRALSIFTTAKVTGKSLRVYFDPNDSSGTACGCSFTDCRVITGAEVLP